MKKELLKKEALERMMYLNLSKSCIKAFKEENKVWESEGIGSLYEVNQEEQKLIDEYEKTHKDHMVYHVIHSFMNLGGENMEMYSMLVVSPYDEDWEYEKESINRGIVFCYVHNKTAPELSEYGSISIRKSIGGLIRTF